MKKWIIPMMLASLVISLLCCNQQENATLLPAETQTKQQLDLESKTISTPVEVVHHADATMIRSVTEEEGNDDSADDDDPGTGDPFPDCIYLIGTVSLNGFPAMQPGNTLCIDCPDDDNCPDTGFFTYVAADGTILCSGDWTRLNLDQHCMHCLGYNDYEFVN